MKLIDFKAEWGTHEKVCSKITEDQWDRIWKIIHEDNMLDKELDCKDCYHCNSSNVCALGALQGMERCKPKAKQWSIWYDYKGEVDFKDDLFIEIEFNDGSVNKYNFFPFDSKRYRIKLDGVRVIDEKKKFNPYDYKNIAGKVLGHDSHNKIIIVKDKVA